MEKSKTEYIEELANCIEELEEHKWQVQSMQEHIWYLKGIIAQLGDSEW